MEYLRCLTSAILDSGAVLDHEQVWTSLYASGRTPWDTGRPASQLVEYTAAVDVSGLRAVELGCGTGASCVHLAVRGCSLVVGVDIAAPAVAAAKARAEAAGVSERCVFVRADALTLRPETLLALVAIRYGNAFDNFDLCFDCRGLQVLWAAAPDRAGSGLARLLAPGATVLTVSGNANEYRAYTGSETALTCAEIVGALAPPAFDLLSLRETHFDAGVGNEARDDNDSPPLAWRAVFVRGTDDATLEGTDAPQPSLDAGVSHQNVGRERPEVNMEVVPEPRLVAAPIGGATTKAAKRVPSVVARKLRASEAVLRDSPHTTPRQSTVS